jgi:hypothetical protein
VSSWERYGTNLSVRSSDGKWQTESERLIPFDLAHFDLLDLGLDELVEAYVQTVLSIQAIDNFSIALRKDPSLLGQWSPDAQFLQEVGGPSS